MVFPHQGPDASLGVPERWMTPHIIHAGLEATGVKADMKTLSTNKIQDRCNGLDAWLNACARKVGFHRH